MPRKSRYNIPIQFWRCPHCGFEHSAADLLRSGWSTFKCKQCGKDFPSGKQ
jgi:transposase-like protein